MTSNDRAREILAYIRRFTRENGYPPTIREIGEAFRISSTNGVRYHLSRLEKAGLLKRSGKISRGIGAVGTAEAPATYSIPLLGQIAAGSPTLAEETYEGSLEPQQLFGSSQDSFALRVRGDSMTGAGILDGDYVVVRRQERANAGEIIVALLDNEATVKTYRPRKAHVELVAENPAYPPRVITPEMPFRILGVVRGVLRTVGR